MKLIIHQVRQSQLTILIILINFLSAHQTISTQVMSSQNETLAFSPGLFRLTTSNSSTSSDFPTDELPSMSFQCNHSCLDSNESKTLTRQCPLCPQCPQCPQCAQCPQCPHCACGFRFFSLHPNGFLARIFHNSESMDAAASNITTKIKQELWVFLLRRGLLVAVIEDGQISSTCSIQHFASMIIPIILLSNSLESLCLIYFAQYKYCRL